MANPRNATTYADGSRFYEWPGPGGEKFDSVTTILKGGVPKNFLTKWAAKAVAEFVGNELTALPLSGESVEQMLSRWTKLRQEDQRRLERKKISTGTTAAIEWAKDAPWRTRDKAADLGSRCHEAAEAHILGTPMPEWDDDVKPYMASFCAFLEDHKPTYEAAEFTVYNRTHGYAGTADALARLDAAGLGLTLIDYKSGKGIYPDFDLQLAAYRFGEFIGLPDGIEAPMPDVDTTAVLHLTPKGYELIPTRSDGVSFQYFLAASEIRTFVDDEGKYVLGKPVPKPTAFAVAPPNVAALVD